MLATNFARRLALMLGLLLLVAGCAAQNGNAQDRHHGFYGGISGGLTRP